MAKADPYSDLRGGVLSSVSGLMPSTIGSWGLQLGAKKGEGHPRYAVADVVAVMLMKEMALVTTLKAARASFIVSKVQQSLPQLVARVRKEWSAAGSRSDKGGPYLVAAGGRHGGHNQGVKVVVVEETDLADVVAGAEVQSLVIVPMRRLIKITMNALERHVWNERNFDATEKVSEKLDA